MGNLFSSFDPQVRIFSFYWGLNWIAALSPLVFIPQFFWLAPGQTKSCLNGFLSAVVLELKAILGVYIPLGSLLVFLALLVIIIFSNFLGLLPYVFTSSSHLIFSITLALPLWLGNILWCITFQFKSIMAHLVPLGTPGGLMPIIVVIETVRSLIRPLTLAIRLAANMIAGHLLLTLLGNQGRLHIGLSSGLVFLALFILMILECAVACIQSYVFTILRSLYLNETLNVKFLQKNL